MRTLQAGTLYFHEERLCKIEKVGAAVCLGLHCVWDSCTGVHTSVISGYRQVQRAGTCGEHAIVHTVCGSKKRQK